LRVAKWRISSSAASRLRQLAALFDVGAGWVRSEQMTSSAGEPAQKRSIIYSTAQWSHSRVIYFTWLPACMCRALHSVIDQFNHVVAGRIEQQD
jgi:hypothetical protein